MPQTDPRVQPSGRGAWCPAAPGSAVRKTAGQPAGFIARPIQGATLSVSEWCGYNRDRTDAKK